MNRKNTHKRILLSKNQSGQLEYCETCDVVEIEIGPVSVRLHAHDLELFSALVQEAQMHLGYYKSEKSQAEMRLLKMEGVH